VGTNRPVDILPRLVPSLGKDVFDLRKAQNSNAGSMCPDLEAEDDGYGNLGTDLIEGQCDDT
jgi:hypothetical protein